MVVLPVVAGIGGLVPGAQGHDDLAVVGALADGVIEVVDTVERLIRTDEGVVRPGKNALAPGLDEVAVGIEDQNRMRGAGEYMHPTPTIDRPARHPAELISGRRLPPVRDELVHEIAAPHSHRLCPPYVFTESDLLLRR